MQLITCRHCHQSWASHTLQVCLNCETRVIPVKGFSLVCLTHTHILLIWRQWAVGVKASGCKMAQLMSVEVVRPNNKLHENNKVTNKHIFSHVRQEIDTRHVFIALGTLSLSIFSQSHPSSPTATHRWPNFHDMLWHFHWKMCNNIVAVDEGVKKNNL